jgi:hypothetical protein
MKFIGRRNNNKQNKTRSFGVLIVLCLGILVGVYLLGKIGSYLTGAFGETVNVSLVPNNASVPPDRYISVFVNAKTNKIGFARVKIVFNPQKIKLNGEAIQTNTLATVLEKTPMNTANNTGTLVLALGLATFDRSTPPTGTFEIARLPFTAVSTIKNDSTTISIDNSDIQIMELAPSVLPHSTTGITVNLNTTVVPTPNSVNTITLKPIDDTYVSAYKSTSSFGSSSILAVDSGNQREIAYLKFDLSALAGKVIDSAQLRYRICTDSSCGSGAAQDVHVVPNTSWSGSTMNWGNKPTIGAIIGSQDGGQAGDWRTINISSGIQSHEGSLFAIAMTQNTEDGLDFYSKESTDAPELIVKYGTGSISPSGTVTLTDTKDAWVDRGNPQNNFGLDKKLSVRNSSQMTSFLSFDLSKLGGKKITSAKLRMHVCGDLNCGSGGTQNIRPVVAEWNEQSLVFNNMPEAGAVLARFYGGSANSWIESDVLSLVRGKEGIEV